MLAPKNPTQPKGLLSLVAKRAQFQGGGARSGPRNIRMSTSSPRTYTRQPGSVITRIAGIRFSSTRYGA